MPPTPEIQYERLTRFALAVRTRGSLWLGPDHLLCVLGNGYLENYKRFYFRDIQAIIIQRTERRTLWNIILALLLAGFGFGVVRSAVHHSIVGLVLCSIPTAIFLVLLAANNLLGPACVCYLRTAVQLEQLPSLYRLGKAQKVLARIRPLIAAAQGGELTSETIAERMRESIESQAGAPTEAAANDPNVPPRLQS